MKLYLYCSCGNFRDDLIIASQNMFKKANIISISFGCKKQFKLHKKLNNGYNINNVMTNDKSDVQWVFFGIDRCVYNNCNSEFFFTPLHAIFYIILGSIEM